MLDVLHWMKTYNLQYVIGEEEGVGVGARGAATHHYSLKSSLFHMKKSVTCAFMSKIGVIPIIDQNTTECIIFTFSFELYRLLPDILCYFFVAASAIMS